MNCFEPTKDGLKMEPVLNIILRCIFYRIPIHVLSVRSVVAWWVADLTHDRSVVCLSPIIGSIVSLSKVLYSNCLVLVGCRNRFERGFKINKEIKRADYGKLIIK